MVTYPTGTKVMVNQKGKYHGLIGVITDYKALNSGFPGASTGWLYEVTLETGKRKWFIESVLSTNIE